MREMRASISFADFAAADARFRLFKRDSEISGLDQSEIAEGEIAPRVCENFTCAC